MLYVRRSSLTRCFWNSSNPPTRRQQGWQVGIVRRSKSLPVREQVRGPNSDSIFEQRDRQIFTDGSCEAHTGFIASECARDGSNDSSNKADREDIAHRPYHCAAKSAH